MKKLFGYFLHTFLYELMLIQSIFRLVPHFWQLYESISVCNLTCYLLRLSTFSRSPFRIRAGVFIGHNYPSCANTFPKLSNGLNGTYAGSRSAPPPTQIRNKNNIILVLVDRQANNQAMCRKYCDKAVLSTSAFSPLFPPAAGKSGKVLGNLWGKFGWARLGHKIYLVQTLFAGDKIALDV